MPRPGHRVGRVIVLLCVLGSWAAPAAGIEIAPYRHAVGSKAPGAYVPYASSHSLSTPNRRITRILFSIHSSGFDALQYYDNARAAAAKVRGAPDETLIIAPHLLEEPAVPGAIPHEMLFCASVRFVDHRARRLGRTRKRSALALWKCSTTGLRNSVAISYFPNSRTLSLWATPEAGSSSSATRWWANSSRRRALHVAMLCQHPHRTPIHPANDLIAPRNRSRSPQARCLPPAPTTTTGVTGSHHPMRTFRMSTGRRSSNVTPSGRCVICAESRTAIQTTRRWANRAGR